MPWPRRAGLAVPDFSLAALPGGRRALWVRRFDLTPSAPGFAGLAAPGRKWDVSGAAAICDEVRTALVEFAPVAEDFGVPHTDIDRFASDIARRLRP